MIKKSLLFLNKPVSSASGQYQTAVVSGGYIHRSTDYGATWTEVISAGARGWLSVSLNK